MATSNRYVEIYRLAESSHSRKSIRNSNGFNASLIGRHFTIGDGRASQSRRQMCVYGLVLVVPDVSQLGLPGGNKAQMQREANKGNTSTGGVGGNGVTGLKSLGVRDLQYKTAFLACMVNDADGRVSFLRLSRSICSKFQYTDWYQHSR